MRPLNETLYTHALRRAQRDWPALARTPPIIKGKRLSWDGASVLTVGSGCSLAVAKLAETAFAWAGAKITRTCTPFEVATSGMKPDVACVVSAKGDHRDTLECFDFLRSCGTRINVLTLSPDSRLAMGTNHSNSDSQLIYPSVKWPSKDDGFIPILPTLALALLIPSIFNRENSVSDQVQDLFALAAQHDAEEFAATEFRSGDHITILCTRWAEAGARDFETRMMESGLIPPTICDPWNFGHGRYMPVATGKSKVVLMATQDEIDPLATLLNLVPASSVLANISAPLGGFWGGLYCMIRSMLLINRLALIYGIDPALPSPPVWGTALYDRGAWL